MPESLHQEIWTALPLTTYLSMMHIEKKDLAYLETQAVSAKRIILNTFGFQAPAFYEKHGYQLFGKIEPCFNDYG
ncbi:hypothetical protein AXX12_04350 [Anaerosporomusa subterranea]|uniref:N-acetyltransferase domain-containing protein n=1 Tax=Anaerosporomusa subterranea TaxID=1794912 RepID=A0A154BTW6_ANASB|nr:hypothetical protein AXX12_04350 [Anaerosporomusa subterranea]